MDFYQDPRRCRWLAAPDRGHPLRLPDQAGWRLALLVGCCCFGYLAVFDQWESAMVTLSSIVVAVPLGIAFGLLLGIQGYRYPCVRKAPSRRCWT